jgi:serine/threonine protein kinase
MNHKHIIRCYDCFETDEEICIVTEFADGGDLYNYISKTPEGVLSVS